MTLTNDFGNIWMLSHGHIVFPLVDNVKNYTPCQIPLHDLVSVFAFAP